MSIFVGHYMAQHDNQSASAKAAPKSPPSRQSSDNPLDSGLRRKFLAFCEENPSADECRVYDV
ncbi:MAG: hypothetical protein EB075_01620 [Bacteroidetes bacterium]|nr:hypothetical protein [Bacteroidota bacterium]